MSLSHRVTAVCATAMLVLGASACTGQESPPDEAGASTASPATDDAESVPSDSAPVPEASIEPDEDTSAMEVDVVGDEGILALQYSGAIADGAAGPSGGKLITGPGGCFALTDDDRPRLLVFPDDATFELQHGKPSATFGGAELFVGQRFTADLTEVPQSSVTGIPERCSKGAGDTVLVIE
ncbi:hypothetical protein [Brevibacterium yomogidense]|uniref:hypothetical protein n=1 Tax=Brevibacterium yomogidense TaxID=946573 RepID=UPI0018DFAD65|nr:hypothetical protein [Brevibacterium yomogidense]